MTGEFSGPPIVEASHNNEDDKDDSETTRKRKKAQREAGYFNTSVIFGEKVEKPEAEDKPESRWQRLMNRFFGSIASLEKVEPEPALAEAEEATWDIPEFEAYDNFAEESVLASNDSETAVYERVASEPEATVEEIPEESEELPETGGNEPPELPPVDESLSSSEPEPEPLPAAEIVSPTETAPTPEAEELVEPAEYAAPDRPAVDMISPAEVYERIQATEPTLKPVKEEVVINKRPNWGPAAVTAFVANRLAKGREAAMETRLKREQQRQDRAIEKLKQRVEKAPAASSEIEQVKREARTAKAELDQVRARAKRFEQLKRPIENLEKRLDKRAEARKHTDEVRKSIEQAVEYGQKPPENPPPLPEISPEVAPVVVMQEVAVAAERNAPLEAAFELRSEIKDENLAQQTQGAASVGAVLAGIHKQTTAQHAAFTQSMQTNDRIAASRSMPAVVQGQNLYRKAAISGFWTGIVIIGILIVIAIV